MRRLIHVLKVLVRSPKGPCFIAALLPLAALAGPARGGTVLATETGPGGHRYEVVSDGTITWNGADTAARAGGGFLVTIGDAAEQSFVEGLLSDSKAPSGSYWFGLHETATEGDYRHVTGVVPAYTHFLSGQPDNFGGNETSGSILWSTAGAPTFDRRGFWNDLPNQGGYPAVAATFPDLVSKGYVVEFRGTGPSFDNGDGDAPAAAVPLPAAVWAFPAAAVIAVAAARRLRRG